MDVLFGSGCVDGYVRGVMCKCNHLYVVENNKWNLRDTHLLVRVLINKALNYTR